MSNVFMSAECIKSFIDLHPHLPVGNIWVLITTRHNMLFIYAGISDEFRNSRMPS